MQDPPVQEETPAHEEWGSWGDGDGAEAEDEGLVRERGARLPASRSTNVV